MPEALVAHSAATRSDADVLRCARILDEANRFAVATYGSPGEWPYGVRAGAEAFVHAVHENAQLLRSATTLDDIYRVDPDRPTRRTPELLVDLHASAGKHLEHSVRWYRDGFDDEYRNAVGAPGSAKRNSPVVAEGLYRSVRSVFVRTARDATVERLGDLVTNPSGHVSASGRRGLGDGNPPPVTHGPRSGSVTSAGPVVVIDEHGSVYGEVGPGTGYQGPVLHVPISRDEAASWLARKVDAIHVDTGGAAVVPAEELVIPVDMELPGDGLNDLHVQLLGRLAVGEALLGERAVWPLDEVRRTVARVLRDATWAGDNPWAAERALSPRELSRAALEDLLDATWYGIASVVRYGETRTPGYGRIYGPDAPTPGAPPEIALTADGVRASLTATNLGPSVLSAVEDLTRHRESPLIVGNRPLVALGALASLLSEAVDSARFGELVHACCVGGQTATGSRAHNRDRVLEDLLGAA